MNKSISIILLLIMIKTGSSQIPIFTEKDLIKLPNTIQQGENHLIIDDMIFLIDRTNKTTGAFQQIKTWIDRRVYYTFDGSVSLDMKNIMTYAFDEWEKYTFIRFIPREMEENYIQIIESNRNSSYVGMTGGRQDLTMASYHTGIAIHELGHALGLIHEHQRNDRDLYVKIFLEHVEDGHQQNFTFKPVSFYYSAYDFLSIMHYRRYAFSAGKFNTIEPQPEYMKFIDLMGQRDSLTAKDILTINNLYNQIPAIFSPENGQKNISKNGTELKWSNVSNATSFQIQVSQDSLFHSVLSDIYVDSPFPPSQQIFTQQYFLTDITPSTTYFWRVRAITPEGTKEWSSISEFTIESNSPEDFWLYPAYPNPFNNATTIKFEIKKSAFVRINIYDQTGKKVTALASANFLNGTYTLTWNAKQFASGVYYCHFQAGSTDRSIKLMFIK